MTKKRVRIISMSSWRFLYLTLIDRPGRRSTMPCIAWWSNCNEQASTSICLTNVIKLQHRCSLISGQGTFTVLAVYLLQGSLCPMMRKQAVAWKQQVLLFLAHHFWRFLGWSKEDPVMQQQWPIMDMAWEEEAGLCSFSVQESLLPFFPVWGCVFTD
jgi:hypothetical protein